MKRLITLLFVLLVAFGTVGCEENNYTAPTEPEIIVIDVLGTCNTTGVTLFCEDRSISEDPTDMDQSQWDFIHEGVTRGSTRSEPGAQISFQAFEGDWVVRHSVWDVTGRQHFGDDQPVTIP